MPLHTPLKPKRERETSQFQHKRALKRKTSGYILEGRRRIKTEPHGEYNMLKSKHIFVIMYNLSSSFDGENFVIYYILEKLECISEVVLYF